MSSPPTHREGGEPSIKTSTSTTLSARCIFLTVTLLTTATSSGLVALAILTDYWEYVDFEKTKVEAIAGNDTRLEWISNNRVARLRFDVRKAEVPQRWSPVKVSDDAGAPAAAETATNTEGASFLVPMYGGLWAICPNVNDEERMQLTDWGYGQIECKKYLSPEGTAEGPNDWVTRMQNLSISCATVCLILLMASALIGLLGLLKRKCCAVLITGVMYILAAIFCVFTLSIMHFKRQTSTDCGSLDPTVPAEYQHAQVTTSGWSLATGWVGVCVCLLSAFLWYLLSKIMRYGPMTLT